jgi:PD-(D/E)XK nuclease superfamily protein
MVAEEGAVLLMAGRRADYERVRSTLKRALEELQRQFRAANVDLVEPERNLVGTFAGGELTGQADLVVRKKTGVQAIVDMKWGNASAYRDRLARNRHLQLTLYAEMFRQETRTWPQVSYFIFDRSQLLAPDKEFFPQALKIPSVVAGGTAALWEEFVMAWKWRRSQIDAGQIEVAIEGITPTVDSEPPPGALQPEIVTEAYQAYRWLTGWD